MDSLYVSFLQLSLSDYQWFSRRVDCTDVGTLSEHRFLSGQRGDRGGSVL